MRTIKPSIIIYEKEKFKSDRYVSQCFFDDWAFADIVFVFDGKTQLFDVVKHRYIASNKYPKGFSAEELSKIISNMLVVV